MWPILFLKKTNRKEFWNLLIYSFTGNKIKKKIPKFTPRIYGKIL